MGLYNPRNKITDRRRRSRKVVAYASTGSLHRPYTLISLFSPSHLEGSSTSVGRPGISLLLTNIAGQVALFDR